MQIVNSIPTPPPDLVLAKDFNYCTHLYYGVKIGGYSGIIHRAEYGSGVYRVFCLDSLTEGNGWTDFSFRTLEATVKAVLKHGEQNPKTDVKVCAFNTFRELVQFLNTESRS